MNKSLKEYFESHYITKLEDIKECCAKAMSSKTLNEDVKEDNKKEDKDNKYFFSKYSVLYENSIVFMTQLVNQWSSGI